MNESSKRDVISNVKLHNIDTSWGIQINSPITAGRASHVFLSPLKEHHIVSLLRPKSHKIFQMHR